MSDEIVYLPGDICSHYLNRIHEITDEITAIRKELAESGQITESSWSDESGRASLDVITKFNEKFREIDNSLSEAENLLMGISAVE